MRPGWAPRLKPGLAPPRIHSRFRRARCPVAFSPYFANAVFFALPPDSK